MDRWLEEYFAELETVFGLGLFEGRVRDGGWEEQTGWMDAEDAVQENGAVRKGGKENEAAAGRMRAERAADVGLLYGPEEMLKSADGFGLLGAEGSGVDAEPDLERELYAVQEQLQRSLGIKADRIWDEPAQEGREWMTEEPGVYLADGEELPFAAVLPPVLRMEQNRRDMAKPAAEWEKVALWKDTVSVREQTETGEKEESRFSTPFPQAAGREKDELVDELLDELERRLMLEIGGAAEGRY